MSRKYLNGRWCVRCGKDDPTPYLRKVYDRFLMAADTERSVVDVGCGNGRNSRFMAAKGFKRIAPLDMACGKVDGCRQITLGADRFPLPDSCAGIVLANYVLMFLDGGEQTQVLQEICRVAAKGCFLVIELYPAKDSHYPKAADIAFLNRAVRGWLENKGWEKLQFSKDKSLYIKT